MTGEMAEWCPFGRSVCSKGIVLPNYGERYRCTMVDSDGECLLSDVLRRSRNALENGNEEKGNER